MLKFSGFADLTSCLGGRAARSKPKRFPRATQPALTTHSPPKGVRKIVGQWVPNIVQASDVNALPEGKRTPNAQTRTQLTLLGPPHIHGEAEQRHETKVDTEAGMLSGVSRKRSIRSNPCWFTEFCKSQCLSHFAAPFIVVRAETSVAESCEEAFNSLAVDAKENIQKHNDWSKTVTAGKKKNKFNS